MAKSTALPGVMRGSTVGTGTITKTPTPVKTAAPVVTKKPATSTKTPAPTKAPVVEENPVLVPTIISTMEDPTSGDIIAIYSDGTQKTLTVGTKKADAAALAREKATTTQAIIKAKLAELQIPTTLIDSSTTFITSLVNDGVDVASAVDVYYNNKSWTTRDGNVLTSPFYAEFTYLQESAPKTGNPPSPLELMQFKLGVKNLVTQYGRSTLFAADDALKGYISNGVKLTDLDARFAEANLLTASADPTYVATLQKMGYISGSQDLADFYADSTIGQKQFEINKNTALFARQALLRSGSGITVDAASMKALAANAPGGTTGNAEQIAAAGYETISQQLQPLTKLEGIYNREAVSQDKLMPQLQTQLEAEQFQGLASELRKKRIEQEQLAFQARSGTIQAGRLTQGSLGTASTSGLI